MSFHFESEKAHSHFLAFVERRKMNQRFRECRQLVHDDPFEARVTAYLAIPVVGNVPNEVKTAQAYTHALSRTGNL
jgi:hypothetical protein